MCVCPAAAAAVAAGGGAGAAFVGLSPPPLLLHMVVHLAGRLGAATRRRETSCCVGVGLRAVGESVDGVSVSA